MPPRAVIIHDRDTAVAALRAARTAGVSVMLISAPGAAHYLGAMAFRTIVDEARAQVPGTQSLAVLDCGDAPGHVLAAFRHGIEAVTIDAPSSVIQRLAEIADQWGSRLVPPPTTALDIRDIADPERACRLWLAPSVAKPAP